MNAYKKYITIEDPNRVVLSDLPFKPGQRVEVIILVEDSAGAISEKLRDLFDITQALSGIQDITEDEIAAEIEGRNGSLGTIIYIDEDFWALNTTLWVKQFCQVKLIYAFYLLSCLKLAQYNSSAAVPTLNRNDIHGLPVVIPSSAMLKEFDFYIQPLFTLKKNLAIRNKNLRETRDLLLTKLISGEIDVENLDIETGVMIEGEE